MARACRSSSGTSSARLAYSTISNLSYILFAAVLMTGDALAAAFLHLITHSVVKIMAFFAAGAVLHYAHREYVDELEGLCPPPCR